jgi:hypothetical protein
MLINFSLYTVEVVQRNIPSRIMEKQLDHLCMMAMIQRNLSD